MNVELNKDEVALILDCLAAAPLNKSYNLFNRLLQLIQQSTPVEAPPPSEALKAD